MSIVSAVTTKIGNAAKKIAQNKVEILGALAIGSSLYDAHINGAERAVVKDRLDTADRYERQFYECRTMDKPSQTIAGLKNSWFGLQKNMSIYHICSKVCGYVFGAVKSLASDLPLIGISALAFTAKKHNIIRKAAGIFLAIHMAKTLIYDILSFGRGKKH